MACPGRVDGGEIESGEEVYAWSHPLLKHVCSTSIIVLNLLISSR